MDAAKNGIHGIFFVKKTVDKNLMQMRPLKWTIYCMIAATVAGSCQTKRTTSNPPADAAHNSRNSLDWQGTYQ